MIVFSGVGAALTWNAWRTSEEGWVRMGSVQDLRRERVLYHRGVGIFVVQDGNRVVSLSEKSPHLGHPIFYCRSSQLFEDAFHGEKFDHDGDYYGGPAPRGMDRVITKIEDGFVYVMPDEVLPGPPRDSGDPDEPQGPFCQPGINDRGLVDG